MARSMFAEGMFTALAAATAPLSRGFASGSPPPWRAAMVISLMYFENSLPRAWSVAAFLRLIVAHFEWPDMVPPGFLPPSRGGRPGLLLGARGRDHLVGELARDLFVVGELGRVHAPPLSEGAEVSRVLVGLGQRHHRPNDLIAPVGLGAHDLAAL